VISELGITMGVLHRDNVRVIYEEGVELPTDISGYAYTALDNRWKENILRELKAMNIL
jgi:predicted nucleotide-binding protein